MRFFLILLALTLSACTMPDEKHIAISENRIGDLGWTVAEGRTEHYPYQIRFRNFPSDFQRSDYPTRLNIFWKMSAPDNNGLASELDIEIMQRFENRIIDATESNMTSVLTAIITGRGEREFVFYVKSASDFLEALRGMPQESLRYPIEIHSSEDREWAYFHEEIREIK